MTYSLRPINSSFEITRIDLNVSKRQHNFISIRLINSVTLRYIYGRENNAWIKEVKIASNAITIFDIKQFLFLKISFSNFSIVSFASYDYISTKIIFIAYDYLPSRV